LLLLLLSFLLFLADNPSTARNWVEVWRSGSAFLELERRKTALAETKVALEDQRKQLTKLKPKQTKVWLNLDTGFAETFSFHFKIIVNFRYFNPRPHR
jgi:hypothetical protein